MASAGAERSRPTEAAQRASELASQYAELFPVVTGVNDIPEILRPRRVVERVDGSTDGDFRKAQLKGLEESVAGLQRALELKQALEARRAEETR